jgi:hypothetical protein
MFATSFYRYKQQSERALSPARPARRREDLR